MPCLKPLTAWRTNKVHPRTGKFGITWDAKQANRDHHVSLPCGRCIECRLNHSREWAIRAVHEASLYDDNCFLTLTYAEEHLPENSFLDYDAPVSFMKRLREYAYRVLNKTGIRSFGCAEYGEHFRRPHYHLCLFNFNFSDRYLWSKNSRGDKTFRSDLLEKLWPYGASLIGALTFESAAYTARYVTKKISGEASKSHYEFLDAYGEYIQRPPEKSVCVSRMPGLGAPWLKKFNSDIFPADSIVLRGVEMKIPKYYDRRFEVDSPEKFAKVKQSRKRDARTCTCLNNYCSCVSNEDSSPRLLVREKVKLLTVKNTLKRNHEK